MFQNPINTQQSDRSLPLILQPGFPGYNDLLKLAPCGIGLMCGKRQANVTDWLESITVAVSTVWMPPCRKRRPSEPLS